jgi:ankyrin repeat protein
MVDVNSREHVFSDTPLSMAVRLGHEEIAWKLLGHQSVDVTSRDINGQTLLTLAMYLNCISLSTRILLTKRATQGMQIDKHHWSICMEGYTSVIRNFLEYYNHLDLNARGQRGRTPLYAAMASDHALMVQLLLGTRQADINLPDAN